MDASSGGPTMVGDLRLVPRDHPYPQALANLVCLTHVPRTLCIRFAEAKPSSWRSGPVSAVKCSALVLACGRNLACFGTLCLATRSSASCFWSYSCAGALVWSGLAWKLRRQKARNLKSGGGGQGSHITDTPRFPARVPVLGTSTSPCM